MPRRLFHADPADPADPAKPLILAIRASRARARAEGPGDLRGTSSPNIALGQVTLMREGAERGRGPLRKAIEAGSARATGALP